MAFNFREVVALILLGLFTAAFVLNPHDQAIVGALLTSFAAAWGFYLGGSKTGSDTAAMNAVTVSDSAKSALAVSDDASTTSAPAPAPKPAPAAPAPAAPAAA